MLRQEALELYRDRVLTTDSKEMIYTPKVAAIGGHVPLLIDKPQQA